MKLIDKFLIVFFKANLQRIVEHIIRENDLEWYQIIESVLGFHPVSKTDALKSGILKVKHLKANALRENNLNE